MERGRETHSMLWKTSQLDPGKEGVQVGGAGLYHLTIVTKIRCSHSREGAEGDCPLWGTTVSRGTEALCWRTIWHKILEPGCIRRGIVLWAFEPQGHSPEAPVQEEEMS